MTICDQCGRTFARNWNLVRHVANCHPTSSRSLTEFPQVGNELSRGMKRKIDLRDSEDEDSEIQETDIQRDIFGDPQIGGGGDSDETDIQRDIFGDLQIGGGGDSDESDREDSYNSSSDESDHCDSSSDDNAEAADEDNPYLNYARWRVPENGAYSFWQSRGLKPYVAKHRKWLKSLLNCKRRRFLIRHASDSQLEAISEVARNVFEGGAVMYITEFQFMIENRNVISLIASERTTHSQLRECLLAPEHALVLPLLLIYAVPPCLKSVTPSDKPVCMPDESGEVPIKA